MIDFGGGVTFSFLRVLSLEKVAQVLKPVQFNGIVNGSHAVLVRTQGTHTLAQKLLEYLEILAFHGEGEGVIAAVINNEAGKMLVTDEI